MFMDWLCSDGQIARECMEHHVMGPNEMQDDEEDSDVDKRKSCSGKKCVLK